MISLINLAVLFTAKVADNALSTTKTILVQRSRWILAGILRFFCINFKKSSASVKSGVTELSVPKSVL